MATTNNITGDEIKSGIYTPAGRDNFDRIFAKKTAHEWLATPEFVNVRLVDPDGWRYDDGVSLDTKISYKDFCRRLNESTVISTIAQ